MNKLELKVEGMVCTGCENRLKNVKNVEASFMEKKVIVEFVKNIDKSEIIEKIKDLGFKVIE